MKPKPQYHTIKTREDNGDATTADYRFPLFYENADRETNGLYGVIGDSGNKWDYNTDKDKTGIHHLPAENTVFINANIALTDGSCKKFVEGKTPHTIPNLYDALTALATKITDINEKISNTYSNADKYICVIKDETDKSVTLYPGTFDENTNTTDIDKTAENIQIKHGNSETSVVISNKDIQFTIKPDGETANTYTLGAIIEAIQELNRRTAFIDSTMTFNEAKLHFDVNSGNVPGASYQGLKDGLPAAADSHYSGTFENSNARAISDIKLPRMKIISYDPGTDDKSIPFTPELLTSNDNALLDDPTVISPESVAIRMRGCPYLLE